MKGTPKKAYTAIDTEAATATANKLTEETVKETIDISKAKIRTVAVRINEIDFYRLTSLFAARRTPLGTAGKAALLWLADQIEAGNLDITEGIVTYKR